ncbi:MAG TPA: TOBE domain-containing protein [Burkholderiaceae bacterium]|nr:TOBE domain-containing protein [Burkholderiaceae bacterium]
MTARRRKANSRLELQGSLWLTIDGESLGGRDRVDLLRAVSQHGSITGAAKAQGVSYKAAWDAIDAMNTLAGQPLVERSAGGRGGGSTHLTARGQRLVDRFEEIDAAHRRFLKLLDDESIDIDQPFSLLKVLNMKTSARNQFVGAVTSLRSGAVNDEVEITLPTGQRIVAVVTQESTQSLGLRTKMTAIALVKASSVVVATDLDGARVSARNQLAGKVSSVTPGAVNAEVVIDLDGGVSIAAIVTESSVKSLGLAPGKRAIALFKATSVIVAVTA